MKYCPMTQLCDHCTPSLVPCIWKSSISMDGSRNVLEEHVSWWTCMLLLMTCKHGWWDTRYPHFTCLRWWRLVWLSWRYISEVRSRTMKSSHNSSLVCRLPMHVCSILWMLWCTHMRSHLLGLSPRPELNSYFDQFMHIATSPDLPISANIMHKYDVHDFRRVG